VDQETIDLVYYISIQILKEEKYTFTNKNKLLIKNKSNKNRVKKVKAGKGGKRGIKRRRCRKK